MIIADLEAIKRRCEAATPGPWEVNGSPHDRHMATVGRHYITTPNREGRSSRNEAIAEFIAHAREDLPALLEAVERLLSMLRDAETEAQMQASESSRLRVCAEWARRTIDEEWPDGPTGDTENWRRFVAVVDRGEGPPPELWAK